MPTADRPSPPGDGISLLDLLSATVDRRGTVVRAAIGGFALAAVFAQFRPPRYESATTVMAAIPSSGESRLAGLASQFGLGDLTAARGGLVASPDLIVQLARSEAVLLEVLEDTVVGPDGTGRSILNVLRPTTDAPSPGSPADRMRRTRAITDLRDLLVVTKHKTTNSATIAVTTEDPLLSFSVVRAVRNQLDKSFTVIGQRQAAEERRFIAERLRERESELAEAEARLAAFLTSNRDFRASPALVFEHDRLQRAVTRQQQVAQSLEQSAEDAAIRAARDTPALLALDAEEVPVQPRPRRRVLFGVLGILAGTMLGLVWIWAGAAIRDLDARDRTDWQRFRGAVAAAAPGRRRGPST